MYEVFTKFDVTNYTVYYLLSLFLPIQKSLGMWTSDKVYIECYQGIYLSIHPAPPPGTNLLGKY